MLIKTHTILFGRKSEFDDLYAVRKKKKVINVYNVYKS